MKYIYDIDYYSSYADIPFIEWLNQHGQDGWLLIDKECIIGGYCCTFVKPI